MKKIWKNIYENLEEILDKIGVNWVNACSFETCCESFSNVVFISIHLIIIPPPHCTSNRIKWKACLSFTFCRMVLFQLAYFPPRSSWMNDGNDGNMTYSKWINRMQWKREQPYDCTFSCFNKDLSRSWARNFHPVYIL